MPKIHLGFYDIPYSQVGNSQPQISRAGKLKNPRRKAVTINNKTTSEVAEELEKKYGILEHFVETHGYEIASDYAHSATTHIEHGSGSPGSPLSRQNLEFARRVKDRFSRFLNSKEMDGVLDNVPTQASLKGINHRTGVRTPGRPSFIDTGLYEAAFVAWITD